MKNLNIKSIITIIKIKKLNIKILNIKHKN